MFWRGDHPAIYRSRAERRREKGLSADLLHQLRRTLGLELIGIGVQTLQRVYGPAAGAELVLHIGGELIEIFLRAGIAAEERVEIRLDRTHEITSRIACTSGGAATQGKFAGNK